MQSVSIRSPYKKLCIAFDWIGLDSIQFDSCTVVHPNSLANRLSVVSSEYRVCGVCIYVRI